VPRLEREVLRNPFYCRRDAARFTTLRKAVGARRRTPSEAGHISRDRHDVIDPFEKLWTKPAPIP